VNRPTCKYSWVDLLGILVGLDGLVQTGVDAGVDFRGEMDDVARGVASAFS
jgi:hypothetical protein